MPPVMSRSGQIGIISLAMRVVVLSIPASAGDLATRGAFGDPHWLICADFVCCMDVMSFGSILEKCKSKSEDLSRAKKQKWK
jgi:hypothetical protein